MTLAGEKEAVSVDSETGMIAAVDPVQTAGVLSLLTGFDSLTEVKE